MRYWVLTILFLILVCTLPVLADDNSLWTDNAANIYQDRPDYQDGDIITVVIEEEADAIQSANTSTSQNSSVDAEAGLGIFSFLKAFGFAYSDSGSADGETSRSGTLRADITTQIEELMPNGNIRIVGYKNIKINGEEQEIKLSGVIRPEDISLDNTISSKKIADANIEYEGEGTVAEKQPPGFFKQILNFIF